MLEENLTQKARCKWWAHVVNALHAKTRARVEGKNWNPLAASNISNVQKVIMQKALLDTMDSCSGWPLVRYIHDVPCLGDLAQAKKSDNQNHKKHSEQSEETKAARSPHSNPSNEDRTHVWSPSLHQVAWIKGIFGKAGMQFYGASYSLCYLLALAPLMKIATNIYESINKHLCSDASTIQMC